MRLCLLTTTATAGADCSTEDTLGIRDLCNVASTGLGVGGARDVAGSDAFGQAQDAEDAFAEGRVDDEVDEAVAGAVHVGQHCDEQVSLHRQPLGEVQHDDHGVGRPADDEDAEDAEEHA